MLDTSSWEVTSRGLTFGIDAMTGRASLSAAERLTSGRGRFWTMSAVTDDDRDLPVHSEQQSPRVSTEGDTLVIRYARLRAVDGRELDLALTVVVAPGADGLVFTGDVVATGRTRAREIALPLVELSAATATEDEVLYRPEGLGRRIRTPRTTLYRAHTEYMTDDGAGVWEDSAYPGELSMPWQGVQTGGGFLYLGRHDPEFTSLLLSCGVPPRGSEGELWLSATTPSDHALTHVGPVVLALVEDWHAGARIYRAWADGWYTGPRRSGARLRGWQRIIMRHQFGQVLFRYDDLVDVYEAGRDIGLDGILLFGWWKGGFDRGYPVYEPDDELGGAEALTAAIATIRERGGFVALYANGNLIDRTSAFAETHGSEVSKKDASGLDYVVGYAFARESRSLRHFSPGSFLIACHGAPAWRATMAEVARTQAALGTDDVFFDQTAYHLAAWPCHDATHDHGERTGTEPAFRAQTLAAIRAAADARTVGSEGMADCMIPLLDYHHGWGFAFQNQLEAFPALFREVYPEPVVSNRLLHDERAGWEGQLHYAFVYNLAFDVAIHRGRLSASAVPAYARRIAELNALRDRAARYFDGGSFSFLGDDPVVHVRYTSGGDALDILWNPSDTPLEAAGRAVPAHAIVLIESGAAR